MVLDDVGDPEKAPNVPPLEPTWKIETSPGSFQWGYVFSEQPTKAEFSAAIRAIADAGYTDKGAINAVRNFRIPGSINLKPGRNNFAAQLREFKPERDFTLEQICAALNVTPGEAEDAYRPIRISDDGTDDVMVWLSDNGLLLAKPNQDIYQQLLLELDTTANRVLFFDDLKANVDGAVSIGIQAVQVTGPTTIFDFFGNV
jgi:beta-phosphoglucomutase-like phosphatase (HAD superfamily)